MRLQEGRRHLWPYPSGEPHHHRTHCSHVSAGNPCQHAAGTARSLKHQLTEDQGLVDKVLQAFRESLDENFVHGSSRARTSEIRQLHACTSGKTT